jgi:hypothetical protein
MMPCVIWLLVLAGAVGVTATLLRWFEQITDAVDHRQWKKIVLLVLLPFAAWMYPSRVAAGRPMAVPHHEPVRGFGQTPPPPKAPPGQEDAQIARLRQKMREQGMIEDSPKKKDQESE